LSKLETVLPRLLALYNRDQTSPTYGQGDRYRWAWKLIDFGNGTFQGAAHGLARLLVNDLLPEYVSKTSILASIDAMFHGADTLRRSNGSMEEAFPYESSFCVTALVAYDLLTCIELLEAQLTTEQRAHYFEIIRPMIVFLHHADETHAFISNHLATAAVALYKWNALTGEQDEKRGSEILNRILKAQSKEGWFREYEGADPGYQTLCTYYLADLHRLRPDLLLHEPLQRSLQFLWHFAHPDGSFGGFYGSRNTRFYYPAGIEYLAKEIPEAKTLAAFMRDSIIRQTTVTLDVMDEPNLIPMFNAYCWAATIEQEIQNNTNMILPALSRETWRKEFPKAGLIIVRGNKHYTVVSWHKGGVCYHFQGNKASINAGVVAKDKQGRYYSTQAYQDNNEISVNDDKIIICSHLVLMHKQLPSPLQLIILRVLNITLMRHKRVGNWIKNALVRLLITNNKVSSAINQRTISFGKQCEIVDEWVKNDGKLQGIPVNNHFSAIHMASQGYWQRQDTLS